MRAKACALAVCLAAAGEPAAAQRSADNAVTAAEDAFGTSIGAESIGLYSPSQVRGFSPVAAGNVRIEGVYMDRQGALAQRLVSGSTIRVGLSAQGYLFPAPTGIVDYRLRDVGDRRIVSVVAGRFAYGAPTVEVDAQLPVSGSLGIAAGASWAHEEYYDGSDARYLRVAAIPRWRPREGVEVVPFWSMTVGRDEQVAPTIVAAGGSEPPRAPRRVYFGQSWAAKDSYSVNTGVLAKARLGPDWALAGGVFRSIFVNEQNFAELFLDATPDGAASERVIADPGQRYASTSGEVRVSRSVSEGDRLHALHLSVRARRLHSLYGGASSPLDLGRRPLGTRSVVTRPDAFAFGQRTSDQVRQATLGVAYELRWRDHGELSLGIQKTDYRKSVDLPGGLRTETRDRPWLLSAAGAVHLTKALAAYGGYTRGLEESGLAPTNAANRNAALPAIPTRQLDAGLRWIINRRMKVVAGAFDVSKPYFNTDEANVFTALGHVRHRGVELSLSGSPADNLSIVAGAVLMRPRVTGPAVDLGRVGPRPLGQAGHILKGNVEYRPRQATDLSFDLALSRVGRRAASRDNLVSTDPYAMIDLGARYRFRIGGSPATFRLQVQNVTNTFAWTIVGSESYGLMDKRRVTAFLAVDF